MADLSDIIKNKRLFDEPIVKAIVKVSIFNAIRKNVTDEEIADFVDTYFHDFIEEAIK